MLGARRGDGRFRGFAGLGVRGGGVAARAIGRAGDERIAVRGLMLVMTLGVGWGI